MAMKIAPPTRDSFIRVTPQHASAYWAYRNWLGCIPFFYWRWDWDPRFTHIESAFSREINCPFRVVGLDWPFRSHIVRLSTLSFFDLKWNPAFAVGWQFQAVGPTDERRSDIDPSNTWWCHQHSPASRICRIPSALGQSSA